MRHRTPQIAAQQQQGKVLFPKLATVLLYLLKRYVRTCKVTRVTWSLLCCPDLSVPHSQRSPRYAVLTATAPRHARRPATCALTKSSRRAPPPVEALLDEGSCGGCRILPSAHTFSQVRKNGAVLKRESHSACHECVFCEREQRMARDLAMP